MPNEYSLHELANLSGVTPRTIRYYIDQGLVPAPTQLGSKARYTDEHLDRIRVIKKLQAAHLPLAEIRTRLRGLAVGESAAEYTVPSDSALDYIDQLLRPTAPLVPPMPALPTIPAPNMPAPSVTPRVMPMREPPEPERAQWERIVLDPDIELHIRRPLTRQQNKRVERLISIARQLLEE